MKRDDLLDLNDVLQHPGRTIAVDISTELDQEGDIDLVRPLEGFLEAVSTGNLLLLKGEFKTRAVVDCARCSGPIEQDIEFILEEEFPVVGTPSSYNPQDYAKVAPEEPYELFEENNLIVEALLRQGLILAMPMQPLCEFGWDAGRPEFSGLANLLKSEDPEA